MGFLALRDWLVYFWEFVGLNCYSRLDVDGESCYHLESEIYA